MASLEMDYAVGILRTARSFFLSNKFTDFTFVFHNYEEKKVHTLGGHKGFISLLSPVLKAGLAYQDHLTRPSITLRLPCENPVGFRLGRVFVHALYGDILTDQLNEEEAFDFAVLVDMLHVDLLIPHASQAMIRFLTVENCHEILSFLDNYHGLYECVTKHCQNFLKRNLMLSMERSIEWTLSIWNHVLDLEFDDAEQIIFPNETTIFTHLMNWRTNSPENEEGFASLLTKIRFPIMFLADFRQFVVPAQVLSPEQVQAVEKYITGTDANGHWQGYFECKKRKYISVRTTEELETAIRMHPNSVHIKLKNGVYRGSFVYESNESHKKIHLVGEGTGDTILQGTGVLNSQGILVCNFCNSSVTNLTVETPTTDFTFPVVPTVEIRGTGNLIENVNVVNSRLEIFGEFNNIRNITMNGDLEGRTHRIRGQFKNCFFENISISNCQNGILLNRSDLNSFVRIIFSECKCGFDIHFSYQNTLSDVDFYSTFKEDSFQSSNTVYMTGGQNNVLNNIMALVERPEGHYALKLVNSSHNAMSLVNGGNVYLEGSFNTADDFGNIGVFNVSKCYNSCLRFISGSEIRRKKSDGTNHFSHITFEKTVWY